MHFPHDSSIDSVPFPVTNHRLASFDYSVKQASQTLSSPSCIPYTLRLWVRRLARPSGYPPLEGRRKTVVLPSDF